MNITRSVVSERDRALIGGGYSNYHIRATRRIHTIRKRLGATTPKGRKYTQRSPVTVQDVAKNTEWVQLLLASAERAWADAMHMKSSQSPENTQKPMQASTKRQIVSRFRRAITYAANLIEVLQDQSATGATSQDILEAKAYLALLKGGLDFERNRWALCIQNYSFVRLVYTALANKAQTDVYQDLLEGTVDPSIRYAAYQEKLPRTKAVSDIAIEHFPSDESEARQQIIDADITAFETTAEKSAARAEGAGDLPTNIDWRGRSVKLEDASISQALGAAKAKENTLAEKYASFKDGKTSAKDMAAAYDDIINARQDAADATKTAIDELVAEGVDQGDARIQSLQITRTAVNYGVIEWRVGRNRVLCGDQDGLNLEAAKPKQNQKMRKDGKEKPTKDEPNGKRLARLRERVALYDSILQNLDAVKQLPGVMADAAFVEELDGKRAYFRALKCLAVGHSYAVNGHISNALALFARAQKLSQQTIASTSTAPTTMRLDVTGSQLEYTRAHLASLTLQYRALADLENTTTTSDKDAAADAYKAPLLERLHLNQYDDHVTLERIVNYPPSLQPIPMQPLFFDLAWEYIQYPGTAQAPDGFVPASVEQSGKDVKTEEAPKKRGWFGFGR
ncbi:signal recognition particle subunit srp68 [Knufia obscura]|uniref:Signal recognition particle subunit SRP68 n=2 Tax=Knufia TaxID=430999 RepID=A0AAN8F214_9EURO|nr:signal recognition particle subunit srp68 [Knufia obscura]KAK5958546.1 signal recognition particle subunit srp68 [Knufia fluminis]